MSLLRRGRHVARAAGTTSSDHCLYGSRANHHYVWLAWSSALLLPWAALYVATPQLRSVMLRSSAVTMLFGITEPIFVPEYWNPPSLFELARRTGFDSENLIFAFAIGGIGSVLYATLARQHFVSASATERTIGQLT